MIFNGLKVIIAVACLAGVPVYANLPATASQPAITVNDINELLMAMAKKGKLCIQAQATGDYAKALQISADAEKELLAAVEKVNNLKPDDNTPELVAQLNYALSFVYFLQGNSYSAQGSAYGVQSEYEKAAPLLKKGTLLTLKSWEMVQANAPLIGQKVDPQIEMLIASNLVQLAETYQLQGQKQAAQPVREQAYQILEHSKLPFAEQWVYRIKLANSYQQQGNFSQADNLLQGIIQNKATEAANLPTTLVYLAQSYQAQQRYAEAEQQLLHSLELEQANPAERKGYPAALIPLASLYGQQQAYAKAVPLLQEAMNSLEKQTPTSARGIEGAVHSVIYLATREMLANAQIETGQYESARERLLQNINLRYNLLPPASPGSKARSMESMAALYEKQQDIPKALDWLQQSHQQYVAHPSDNTEQAAQFRWLARRQLWLLDRGMAYQQLKADAILPDVFLAMQQSHGNKRTHSLRQTSLRLSAGSPAIRSQLQALWDKQQTLHQLEQQEAELFAEPNPAVIEQEKLYKKLQQTSGDIQQLDAQLRQTFPAYTALIHPVPLTIPQAQALLKPDEALLVWTLSERAAKSWLLVIRSTQAPSLHALDINQEVLQTTLKTPGNNLLAALADPQQAFNLQAAYGLYQTLLAPAAKDLEGVRHIFAVPDGALQNLPLHVLLKTPPSPLVRGNDAYAKADWLVNHYAFSYLPAVHALADLRKPDPLANSDNKPLGFTGFGNPLLQGSGNAAGTEWMTQLAAQLTRAENGLYYFRDPALLASTLPALPETASELLDIAHYIQAKPETALFLGKNATESQLKQLNQTGTLRHSRIISFASHALLPVEDPSNAILDRMEAGLVLTPPTRGSVDDDGYLSASEIASLNLQADWVLLSACNTGTLQGDDVNEGLSALAKAFFVAGAKSVLASLWSVNSSATERLMEELFNGLQQQPYLYRAEALRRAMQIMSRQSGTCDWLCWLGWQEATQPAHPAYWAAFVIYGEGGGW